MVNDGCIKGTTIVGQYEPTSESRRIIGAPVLGKGSLTEGRVLAEVLGRVRTQHVGHLNRHRMQWLPQAESEWIG